MKKTVFFLMSFLLLYSCSDGIVTDDAKYLITYDDSHFVDVNDIVTDLEVIELENIDEALIPVITSISVNDDKYFVFPVNKMDL